MYDSRPETHEHIAEVRGRVLAVAQDLIDRADRHDRSKLEYKAFLGGMGEGLSHHYEANDHHPEHFPGGVQDMNLVQVIEMLADWKAATMRHVNGSLQRSIVQNADRFGYGKEFMALLLNTATYFGWLDA
jgi:hypothetical protein